MRPEKTPKYATYDIWEIHLEFLDAERLEVKGQKKMYHMNE